MSLNQEALVANTGLQMPTKLSKVDRRIWLAFARLAAEDPLALESDTNRELMIAGRLEYGEAALAREAPASRNTIAANRERLAAILEGLRALEARRVGAREAAAEKHRNERRTSVQKDRIIEQQLSVIAAQLVELHALKRRLAANAKRAVTTDDPSPALGHRRRPARASAPPGRGASQDAR